jgi:hypothetical protein
MATERLPMPHGFDPLADDPYRGPCVSCGADADFDVLQRQFICEECFRDISYSADEE